MGLGKACTLRGIHGKAIPNVLNADQAHLSRKSLRATSFLAPGCVTAEGQGRSAELRPKPCGHWHLACALPEAKNACCDAHSDLLETLSVLT